MIDVLVVSMFFYWALEEKQLSGYGKLALATLCFWWAWMIVSIIAYLKG